MFHEMTPPSPHGGPDEHGVPLHDFSTNANACGPCGLALAAVQQADAAHYPDPSCTALRAQLAAFHGVAPERVLPMASASEAIARLTAAAVRVGWQRVGYPAQHFGDVARQTHAWGLTPVAAPTQAQLWWACEPGTPHGQNALELAALPPGTECVLDCAYAPLRLAGDPTISGEAMNRVWQLWSPNKALGLTGVRAAYLLAPAHAVAATGQPAPTPAGRWLAAVQALAPSWVWGGHGVALLQAWCQPAVQRWLATSRQSLASWKTQQLALCQQLGWACAPSHANYHLARPQLLSQAESRAPSPSPSPSPSLSPSLSAFSFTPIAPTPEDLAALASLLAHLRQHSGIKLRDATSFGLPGWVRLGVLPPESQQALRQAVLAWRADHMPAPT